MHKYLNKILILLFCSISISSFAQSYDLKQDINLLMKSNEESNPDKTSRSFIYKNDSIWIHKLNPINLTFGTALFVYQNLISKHLSAGCLYSPTCSEFSKDAIREFGLLKGIVLSADRLTRCTRISATDLKTTYFDPSSGKYSDPISKYKFHK